jgi:hypothetical protein
MNQPQVGVARAPVKAVEGRFAGIEYGGLHVSKRIEGLTKAACGGVMAFAVACCEDEYVSHGPRAAE